MKAKKYRILFFTLILAGLMMYGWISADRKCMEADAAETSGTTVAEAETPAPDTKVKPIEVDYEALWLIVDAKENKKVYYSDKSQKVWYEAKAMKKENEQKEYYYIDISWLSATSNSVISLKGDVNEEIVSLTLPARDSKFKAKFNKVTGEITFENVSSGVTGFEWRKATSYIWTPVTFEEAKNEKSDFREEIEKMRISGASIYVRLPQTKGTEKPKEGSDAVTTTEFDPGARQSKEIKLSITKRAAAPKVTIDGTKLLLNTKDTMEYLIDGGKWEKAESKMPIDKISQKVLYSDTNLNPVSVTILIRTKETATKAYSKSFVLTIPAQRPSPNIAPVSGPTAVVPPSVDVVYYSDESKFYMNFTKASKTEPYEYLVVKPGITTPDLTKGWKAVTSAKPISLSSKTATAGSAIYIRKKTVKANTKNNTPFELASAYKIIRVSYTTPTPTPAK